MDSERAKLLNLLYPDEYPAEWDYNVQLDEYLTKLGSYKVDDLIKEPTRLRDEKSAVHDQTQELALTNYKVFIETADCSRDLFTQFKEIDGKVNKVLSCLPEFEKKCHEFNESTSGINHLRKLNSLTLTRNAQLLEILEMPQLMSSFINDELYEDALELAGYVRKLYNQHPDIPIFKSILDDVNQAWLLMLHKLLSQLSHDLNLPKCLQIVSHLRQMEVFTESELRLKFLHARDLFLQNCLTAIPNEDVNHHITKTIDVTRVNLFNIVTQYKATFNDDEHSPLASIRNSNINQNVIFYSWINKKISEFLKTLETDLSRGVNSVESILGQSMYFGLSFSKVGCDFRSLMIPIFTGCILRYFQDSVKKSLVSFEKNIEKFTLINKNHPNVPWKNKTEDHMQPPDSLLEFYPLAEYLNNILNALNELRVCAPISIIDDIVNSLEDSLIFISKSILILYTQEKQAFTPNSKDAFTRLCMCFADDLVPYLQKSIHIIFPPGNIAAKLGITVQTLQNENISFFDKNKIVEHIGHLLPTKIEPEIHLEENIVEKKQEDSKKSEL
ncbi:unnamed protein product [Brassicogethes aeneus]|uniref:Conserved oligomeric Golgi complex subunit 8 n=1 Tax=Brassicogethes aeneus TaxID=1431903 RepID=A0A9P0FL38_BRAAE|nr:unnamed protein product [Brassicogethes aeneus]